MSGQIFISYRRDDSSGWTGRLCDHLSNHFPSNQIFIDVDSVELGEDFVKLIEKTVGSCDVLIAVIGKLWITSCDHEGQRRLDNPEDFVRLEIATALKRDIRVIPVLVDGAAVPRPGDLPDDLKGLIRRNALQLSHDRFRTDAERLASAVERALEKSTAERCEREEKEQLETERRKTEANERLEADRRTREERERLRADQETAGQHQKAADADNADAAANLGTHTAGVLPSGAGSSTARPERSGLDPSPSLPDEQVKPKLAANLKKSPCSPPPLPPPPLPPLEDQTQIVAHIFFPPRSQAVTGSVSVQFDGSLVQKASFNRGINIAIPCTIGQHNVELKLKSLGGYFVEKFYFKLPEKGKYRIDLCHDPVTTRLTCEVRRSH